MVNGSTLSRPTTIRDDTILEAACRVFLTRGVGARTAEVAAAAKVSEGSVFKRFPTKAILFREAVRAGIGGPVWPDGLVDRSGQGDIKETLVEICREALAWHRRARPLIALATAQGEKVEVPAIAESVQLLAGYLETEMRLGRLASHDPMLTARVILGSIERFAVNTDMGDDEFLYGTVGLLMDGLALRDGPTGRKGSAR